MTRRALFGSPGGTGWRGVLRDVPGLPFIMVTVALHMMMFGMLTPVMALYAQGFDVSEWRIGLMITVFAVGRLAADIPAGHAAARIGLGRLLWAGPLLCAAGSLIGALAFDYWVVLAGRLMQGVGSGVYMTAATIFCARASSRANRGRVMALYQGALLTGAAAGPALGGLAAGAFGIAGPFWVAAAIGMATAVYAVALFGERDEPAAGGSAGAASHGSMRFLLLLAPFVCVLLVNFGIFLTRTAAQWQMIPLLAHDRFAMGPDALGVALTLSALANLAVLPLAGVLVDTVPRGWIIVCSLMAAAAALALIVSSGSAAALYVGMIAMGAATGLGGPAVAAYAVDVVPETALGPAMGLMRFAGDLGYLVGPLSLGVLVDLRFVDHGGAILVNAALLAAFGVVFAIFARTPRELRSINPSRETAMTERIWDRFLTERDKAVFAASGFGAQAAWGERPALLVIDVNYAFCGETPTPILESIKKWRTSCGEDAWEAIPVIQRLILTCRERGVPIIYTTGVRRPDNWDGGSWNWKNSRGREAPKVEGSNRDGNTIVDDIAPGPQDLVILKQKPSGFFGTPMQSYLQLLGCDSVIVTGTTTSGCVRATVLDAFSQNFRCTLVEDACFDRSQASHAINLCDMHAKYANVLHSDEVLDHLRTVPQGLFDLPSGEGMARAAAE